MAPDFTGGEPTTLQSTAAGHVVQLRGQTLVERARKMDPAPGKRSSPPTTTPSIATFFRRLGNRDVAEDAAADVFLNAVRGIERFRYQGIALRAWLYGIAHCNRAVDHVRREVPRQFLRCLARTYRSRYSPTRSRTGPR
ncbi:MAG: sigma factor [Dehalococcoidia bacterium]